MLFTFPSRYWFTIGLSGVFSLAGWCRRIHTGFLRSRATQDTRLSKQPFRVPGCHRLWHTFPGISTKIVCYLCRSYNPTCAVTPVVWANPRSLATTWGITIVFFSYGYLDVSVPHVCFPFGISRLNRDGLPHSEISGSKVICTYPKLIAACHVLHRL